jgi:hypothetical protein
MQTSASAPPIIIGLDAMGELFGRTRQTIARWVRTQNFPAARLPTGEWMTTPSLIDAWILARTEADPYCGPKPDAE